MPINRCPICDQPVESPTGEACPSCKQLLEKVQEQCGSGTGLLNLSRHDEAKLAADLLSDIYAEPADAPLFDTDLPRGERR